MVNALSVLHSIVVFVSITLTLAKIRFICINNFVLFGFFKVTNWSFLLGIFNSVKWKVKKVIILEKNINLIIIFFEHTLTQSKIKDKIK